MDKKPILFEAPVFVLRKITLPYLFVLIVVGVYFLGSIWKEQSAIPAIWFDSVLSFILLLLFPIAAAVVSTHLIYTRIKRYKNRFTRLNGRVCFVCNYEIDITLDQCSECGTDWSIEGLNAEWLKPAESDQS